MPTFPRFDRRDPKHLKVAAAAVGSPAVAMLVLFTLGESFSGDLSGLAHLLQLVPLLIVLALAWRYPGPGGALLVIVSVVLMAVYPLVARGSDFGVVTVLLVELLFLAPPLAAGLLFLAAAREARARGRGARLGSAG